MTVETFVKRVEEFAEQIDKEQYPEMVEFFENVVGGRYWFDTAYELSSVIYNCDKQEILPKEVAKLLIDIYNDEIEVDNHDAMCDFGSLYYTGRIGEQNYEKAFYYYEMSAKLGNRQAQENLGYCWYYGRTGIVDYEKAYHYFIKGALDNHLISLYKIGDMYKNGYYVEKDEKEAWCIYKHCLDGLNEENTPILGADVHIRIADCLFEGIGVEQNLQAALAHYQVAERLYWLRLQDGDFLIKKQFERSVEMQEKIRIELRKGLPGFEWVR